MSVSGTLHEPPAGDAVGGWAVPGAPSPDAGLAEVRAVRAGWAALPPTDAIAALPDDAVLQWLLEVEGQARRVDAVRVALVAEIAERSRRELGAESLARRRGCRSAHELVQRLTGAPGITVSRWMRVGQFLRVDLRLDGTPRPRRFAALGEALDEGRVSVEAAAVIIDQLKPTLRVAARESVEVACGELVAAAQCEPGTLPPLDVDEVRVQAKAWAMVLDQDGAPPEDADGARRYLTLRPGRGGLVRIAGQLLPEVAGALEAFADACTNPRTPELPTPSTAAADRAAAHAAAASRDGAGESSDDATSSGADETVARVESQTDARTRAQVLHDVLASALNVAARVADQRSVAGNAPTLLVAVRQEDLDANRGRAFILGGAGAGDGAVSVSLAAARRVGCAGAVQRVLVAPNGRIAGIGSPQRCFTGSQRRAIALRDGGCVIPGCHVPAAWCEVHHVTPHAEDHDGTHTDNGVLLCWHHHRTLDTNGWQIRIRAGIPEVRPPARLRRLAMPPAAGPPARSDGSSRIGSPAAVDDGWRRATGSPARFLHTLRARQTVFRT